MSVAADKQTDDCSAGSPEIWQLKVIMSFSADKLSAEFDAFVSTRPAIYTILTSERRVMPCSTAEVNVMVNVFDYLDYRKFLRDYYSEQKKLKPHFSHRYIAGKLGFDSGYFSKIIQTERHISISLAQKFAEFCQLSDKESEYFRSLVIFAKAGSHSEKEREFQKLLSFKNSKATVISEKQYKIFDKWYYLAIRELIACCKFTGDFVDLGRRVQPPISAAKAKKTVAELVSLGFIRQNGGGVYERVEPVWKTDHEVESVVVQRLQKEMNLLANEAYDRYTRKVSNMSTLTLSVSEKEYQRMVEELANLRTRFLEMARNCQHPDRVYQCNFSLFPLSKTTNGELA
jgi:uncharacterized protein (TIGR02147 family)